MYFFYLAWSKTEKQYCSPNYPHYDTLHEAKSRCLKDTRCVNIVDRHCQQSKFSLCYDDSKRFNHRTHCLYTKPGDSYR